MHSEKLRIIYFYQYFGTTKGGWSTRVYEMCRRWVDEGHEVTVITSPYDKSDIEAFKGWRQHFAIDGIDVIVLNVPQSNKDSTLKRIVRFLQYIVLAVYYVFRLRYDVAVASSGPITVGFLGLVAKKIRRKKFVFEVRDMWPEGSVQLGVLKNKLLIRLSYWFEHLCYKNAHLIVACSEGMKADIYNRFQYSNIVVVPNACDTQFFAPFANTPKPAAYSNKRLIVYAGSLGVMDHCMQIMEAARLLDTKKYPDVVFLIIGDGIERSMMEAYKKEHQLEHVIFLGLIPKTEVAPLLTHAVCSIVCFKNVPVLNTVSPNKMFDAFAAGVPIVQTTQGWIKEMLEEHKAGITVLPDAPEDMIAAMCIYLNDEQRRNNDANNARVLAAGVFSRDKCATDMLQSIKEAYKNSWAKRMAVQLGEKQLRSNEPSKVKFVVDWYTPSSHATSLRMKPWVDALNDAGKFSITIHTDKGSKGQAGVIPNFFSTPDNRTKPYVRFMQELLLGTELFLKVLVAPRQIVIISSPPFIVSCMVALGCFFSRKPYVFDVRDIYPLVYANSGFISRNGWVFKLLFRVSKYCYNNSLFTSTVTPLLVGYIQNTGKKADVQLIKNGFNGKLFIPVADKEEKFTLAFHGNIGQFQNPELLVEVVRELNNRGETFHCIAIGSGSKEQVFKKAGLNNLEFKGRLNNEELAKIIQKAHVGLSFRTDDEISARSIPVRVSEYIGVGIPTVLTPKSEGGELLDTYQVGKAFDNDEVSAICDFIQQLKYNHDLYQFYKNNAIRIRSNFSREAGAELFVRKMKQCLKVEETVKHTSL